METWVSLPLGLPWPSALPGCFIFAQFETPNLIDIHWLSVLDFLSTILVVHLLVLHPLIPIYWLFTHFNKNMGY